MLSFQNTNTEKYIFYQERKNAVSMNVGSYNGMASKEGADC